MVPCHPCAPSSLLTTIQCDRAAAGCTRCKRAGQQCIYAAPEKCLRIRNQTDRTERHAVRAWRARSKHAQTQAPTVEPPFSSNVETLACHRFIYDFSKDRNTLSGLSAFPSDKLTSAKDALTKEEQRGNDGAKAAFIAASLANFHRRHHDPRAPRLATAALGKALSSLALCLQFPHAKPTHNMVLMAILLGLHQVCVPIEIQSFPGQF